MAKRIGVLIGRFQGYHIHHHEHLKRAAMENDLLVVIVGSHNRRRSIKNPWTADERIEMIEANIKDDPELNSTRIVFRKGNDHPDDNVWADMISGHVNQFVNDNTVVTLYGANKDASSFYLGLFPEWEQSLTPVADASFDATQLREMWFNHGQWPSPKMRISMAIPFATILWLDKRKFDPDLQSEWMFYQKEKVNFAAYPYPETLTFCCADAVLTCHDKVLMVRRKFAPGRNCLAIPGGFKNRTETFQEAAIRELYEETGLDIPEKHLRFCIVDSELFDDPSRSLGIPRATRAVHIDVSRYYIEGEFPKTNAQDDAAEVVWVPYRDIIWRNDIYDDHAAIVYTFTK